MHHVLGKSLQIIMEHAEKLSAMIHLRDLQNTIRNPGTGTPYSDSAPALSGSIWDIIQLLGEKSRQNTVLLMDRDNAEVFYSKVSEIHHLFDCLHNKLPFLIPEESPVTFRVQRSCQLSTMCVTIINAGMSYREENHMWYPSPEGITPWYCQSGVRSGMWGLACLMVGLLDEVAGDDKKLELYSHLEVFVKVLLEVYSGAVSAKVEREEEHGGLLDEYWSRRDALLHSLYQQVKAFNQVQTLFQILIFRVIYEKSMFF